MMASVQGTQSGGAVYRRLVLRTIACTVGIVTSYAITTLIVVLALLGESTENDKVRPNFGDKYGDAIRALAHTTPFLHKFLPRVGRPNIQM